MDELLLEAPIVAVAVYPDRARVTRRGMIRLPAGDQRVLIEPLPLGLQADSVRVAGHGPATVLGVDVVTRHHPSTPDESAAALKKERRSIVSGITELTDADAVQAELAGFLEQLARRAGGSYARRIAAGDAAPDLVTGFTDSLAERLSAVAARRRELAEQRQTAEEHLAEVERRLAAVSGQQVPDRQAAVVSLAAEQEADVEIEVSYVVPGAGWSAAYDVRLTGDELSLSWFGLVSQHTGEDWPECDLTLSTARPSGATRIPELDPWYLDRYDAMPVAVPGAPAEPLGMHGLSKRDLRGRDTAMAAEGFAEPPEFVQAMAGVAQGVAAASYRPSRPVAVPADGASHRAMIAVLGLEAGLDYITAPVRSTDVHLRATVTNSSEHTLPFGRAAVFHDNDFVGSAGLPVWAPGEEVELALGLDDRIRVERKLVRRTATKAPLGSTRRHEVEYETTITNHSPRPAKVSLLDQVPVSRDDGIVVKGVSLDPEPAERTDLGVVTWKLELDPGMEAKVRLGLRVELGKNVVMSGWRE